MPATTYVTGDLDQIRADRQSWGIRDWTALIATADTLLDREIELNWYRGVAEEHGLDWRYTAYDRTKLLTQSQFSRAASYLVLALAAESISRGDDAFGESAKTLKAAYREEIKYVLEQGVDYDFVSTSASNDVEKAQFAGQRRLKRG